LVFANILAQPLVELAPDIHRALKPGGLAILSGLLRTQEETVRAAYDAPVSPPPSTSQGRLGDLVLTR
jgi:ribosomal protein L11 methylase PrmA